MAWTGVAWLLARRWPWEQFGAAASQSDVLKVALGVVAAGGAAVALVVNYRRQQHLERDEAGRRDQVRLFTERFGAAAAQLGGEQAAVRLAGVYAMAALADEWQAQRQQCIDVLCGYLRLPYVGEPTPGHPHTVTEQRHYAGGAVQRTETTTYRSGEGQVRSAIVETVRQHLQPNPEVSWSDLNFDLRGATLVDASFDGAMFCGKLTSFERATFCGKRAHFVAAEFSSDYTSFDGATFSSDYTRFENAKFSGDYTSFYGATFSGEYTRFNEAQFSNFTSFDGATFCGTHTTFVSAEFSSEGTRFDGAVFSSEYTRFDEAKFSGQYIRFEKARFSGRYTSFDGATFSGTYSIFDGGIFSGDTTTFSGTRFSSEHTLFDGATFTDVDGAMRAAEFSKPERVVWGPIPPRSSPADRPEPT